MKLQFVSSSSADAAAAVVVDVAARVFSPASVGESG